MSSATKTQRWLDLIAFLAGRRMPVAVDEIMERVPSYAGSWSGADDTGRASVRRKFERDKDELRELGIPIETVDYTINYGTERVRGYRLRTRDFYLPYLRLVSGKEERNGRRRSGSSAGTPPGSPTFELREEEARAAVEALHRVAELPSFPFRRQARSALRKLTFDLDPGALPAATDTPVHYLDPPGARDVRDHLRTLSGALLRRKEVQFGYYGIRRDTESERRVQPYGLLFQHSHWYLIGHDRTREDVRIFRVGRMKELRADTKRAKTADYEIPEDFDLRRWAGRPPWALPGQDEEPLDVLVRFDFPRSLWAERNGHGKAVETGPDGAQVRRFRVQDTDPFVRWLLTLGADVRVESPPELEEERRSVMARVAAVHESPAPGREGSPGSDLAGREDG